MPRVKLFDKEEVLQKAIELFWKKGYNATSINDLVTHLGLSRSSIYDTFGDKHELFERAFEHYQKQNLAGLQSYLDSQEEIRSGLRALFGKAVDEALNDPDHKGCLMVNTTTEMVPGDEVIRQKLIENRQKLEHLFAGFIQRGISSGELPLHVDPEVVASMLFTLYSGLNVSAKINPDKHALIKSTEAALRVLDH